ncbi:MAG: hypothetical protein J6J12_04715 [Oscillospiraceae bacterium]|nr:hypothetical protein [Oscillospiraceae bacterium]
MKREDLFLAIGQVEECRLARTEMQVSNASLVTEREKHVMNHSSIRKRIFRNCLTAAIIVSMLAVTAYAVGGFLIFESPQEMITTIFGDHTGYDHKDVTTWTDPEKPDSVYLDPAYDRVPADEQVVEEEAAPLVEAVGRNIQWNGYILTIDANLYDSATKCGAVIYTLENPKGLSYEVQSDGSVWFPSGEIIGFGQYGYSYILRDRSSNTKLTATYYYQLRDPENTDLVIGFTQWASTTQEEIQQNVEAIKQQLRAEIPEEEIYEFQKAYYGADWPWFEENRTRDEIIDAGYEVKAYERLKEITVCPDQIVISEDTQKEMESIALGGGKAILSPIALVLHCKDIGIEEGTSPDRVVIQFTDGTEYTVCGDDTANYVFNVGDPEGNEISYMFNRIINVDEISAVLINGVELRVD